MSDTTTDLGTPVKFPLSIGRLASLDACDLSARVARLEADLGRRVREDEQIPLHVWARTTPHTSDILWALATAFPESWEKVLIPIYLEGLKIAVERVYGVRSHFYYGACKAALVLIEDALAGSAPSPELVNKIVNDLVSCASEDFGRDAYGVATSAHRLLRVANGGFPWSQWSILILVGNALRFDANYDVRPPILAALAPSEGA